MLGEVALPADMGSTWERQPGGSWPEGTQGELESGLSPEPLPWELPLSTSFPLQGSQTSAAHDPFPRPLYSQRLNLLHSHRNLLAACQGLAPKQDWTEAVLFICVPAKGAFI